MAHFIVTYFHSNWLAILQKLVMANSPRFGLAIRELPSYFQTY